MIDNDEIMDFYFVNPAALDVVTQAEIDIATRVKINSVVDKSEFETALKTALKAATIDSGNNIFDNQFSLTFNQNNLKVMARQDSSKNNFAFAVTAKIKCDTADSGEILAKNPKILLEWLNRVDSQKLAVCFDGKQGERIAFKTAKGELALNTQDTGKSDDYICNQFTKIIATNYDYSFGINAVDFKNAITNLLPCCYNEKGFNSKPALENICLHFIEGKLLGVASNGKVFKACEIEVLNNSSEVEGEILLPVAVANILKKMLPAKKEIAKNGNIVDDGGKVIISSSSKLISLKYSLGVVEFEIIFIRSTAEYPDFMPLLNRDVICSTVVKNVAMCNSLKKAWLVAKQQLDKTKSASLTITSEGGTIYTDNMDGGKFSESVDATFNGQIFSITFNAKVFLDYFTAASKKGTTQIEVIRQPNFNIISLSDTGDTKTRFITMPVECDIPEPNFPKENDAAKVESVETVAADSLDNIDVEEYITHADAINILVEELSKKEVQGMTDTNIQNVTTAEPVKEIATPPVIEEKAKGEIKTVENSPIAPIESVEDAVKALLKAFQNQKFPAKIARTFIARDEKNDIPSNYWSLGNIALMTMQGTNDARGYNQWKKVGRHVKAGTKAIYILVPKTNQVKTKNAATGEEETTIVTTGFKRSAVFKVEDTEGAEIKIPDYTPKTLPPFFNVAGKLNLKVEYMPFTKDYLGFYSHNQQKIQLNSYDVDVYFHELAHAVHDTIEPLSKVSKEKAEIVAEFSAAVLCQIVGIEGQAFNSYEYVKKYCNAATPNGIVKQIMKLLSTVEKVVSTILNAAKESADDTPQIEVTDNTPADEEAKSEGDIAALEIEQPALDFDDTATQKDDELTPPSKMTNDNSTPQIENPASNNNSDNNGKGGDITAVVETSDNFTIDRFSEESQTKTPLEELIEEYNATKDAAKKLSEPVTIGVDAEEVPQIVKFEVGKYYVESSQDVGYADCYVVYKCIDRKENKKSTSVKLQECWFIDKIIGKKYEMGGATGRFKVTTFYRCKQPYEEVRLEKRKYVWACSEYKVDTLAQAEIDNAAKAETFTVEKEITEEDGILTKVIAVPENIIKTLYHKIKTLYHKIVKDVKTFSASGVHFKHKSNSRL